MRIAVADIGRAFGRQTRAYAEYRIFSTLARFSDVVREANVELLPLPRERHAARCRVTLILEGDHRLYVSGRGRHAYDAINRTARRVGDVVTRRTGVTSGMR
ncbi:MAG TPA: hypothetical protein VL173_09145 [Vicinamibacterales bacterium]|jgi:hypothetical protein|nr:hypothetical protein [Vicinamibacterales bacterium]